ncbi:MAG: DUF4422 domain-containing protein [Ruminococcus sp.]|nr:DUF4422 domain-containing protein [Ruminococcus sp.]
MDIKIIVASHKPYKMPADKMYLPVQVGACGKESIGFQRDDEGENISVKNPGYCELTGLYWAWKNLDADYIGLVHYRRHFSDGSHFKNKWDRVITQKALEKKLAQCKVLLPKPRDYWIESNYSHYAHAHHAADLDITRKILEEKYPRYIPAFDKVMSLTIGHRFNMFVMEKRYFKRWCSWLFSVLSQLEKRLDISTYSDYDARVFGFVAERLLDVWLITNKVRYKDIPYVFMEKQNWLKKGWGFVKRKLCAHGSKKEE